MALSRDQLLSITLIVLIMLLLMAGQSEMAGILAIAWFLWETRK